MCVERSGDPSSEEQADARAREEIEGAEAAQRCEYPEEVAMINPPQGPSSHVPPEGMVRKEIKILYSDLADALIKFRMLPEGARIDATLSRASRNFIKVFVDVPEEANDMSGYDWVCVRGHGNSRVQQKCFHCGIDKDLSDEKKREKEERRAHVDWCECDECLEKKSSNHFQFYRGGGGEDEEAE